MSGVKWVVAAVAAAWLAAVAVVGASGGFLSPPGTPPIPVAVGALAPLLLFFLAYRASRAFRDWVLALDLRVMVTMQAWRFAGLGFVALYANGVLPAGFALPAGLGDLAIGATAPLVLIGLLRNPAFAAGGTFVLWNLLGMLDLVTAVATGTMASLFATGAPGEITTAPMAHLPLLFIPVYLVPILFALHVVALLQARRRRMP
jgi:hypothetical protein